MKENALQGLYGLNERFLNLATFMRRTRHELSGKDFGNSESSARFRFNGERARHVD
jgi:hypothetical protein